MSVMTCIKRDCWNIMCDTYVPLIGYICPDCQREFKEWLEESPLVVQETEDDLRDALEHWVTLSKRLTNPNKISVNEFFAQHTRTD